ncbi:MAG: bifunctional aldolase/short-chain dehydrogenase [Rhodospirillaceae bacterium]|jgi:rhamnose utilization protein RhaD (predicted bifunctional aldolase and dehydrogenase)/NAD(P)-dependent dehydrogenase (short-subunit alcohol dehydrogenase family)|nr:bifunctional aldolase/short-chain dehydrogenase [Rhodospirillaceae bacterium]MBT4044559.1 bifunctional aldolase/short-chain dehydrogenase [Rhodospirillaceae bacterium]MBT4688651.1 bifunctional aldolase/short-chain dehydrogenase [Rhodospirillaceae bacterium]MBT5078999.1 bifunctional aldolase/short-chain dehydrogenase [Rhodospirillaceae bacterium]MBT5523418.1 bifunctional aldolase/short-chain dehydrogenase [Rhodospirillaceae bacterium]
MENLWSDRQAQAAASQGADAGIGEELALRLYSARLLGQDRTLVLHGGGNVSLKAQIQDPMGDVLPAMYIKGSGCDMARLEAAGIPAVRLEPLRRLRTLPELDDLGMVSLLRGNLLDAHMNAQGPDPSVETLLHAFLPAAYVDHTHASAVLALTDQADGMAICAEVFGEHAAVASYAMSGLALAKAVIEAYEGQPGCRGVILSKHGLVSFGASAAASYRNMIDLVDMAERHVSWGRSKVFPVADLPASLPSVAQIGPILRSVLAREDNSLPGGYRRLVLDHRGDEAVMNFVNGQALSRYSQAGVVTPDHAIRTKGWPAILPAPDSTDLTGFADAAAKAVSDYTANYQAYFERHKSADTLMLDPLPNVILVPGVGLFAAARTWGNAAIVADIAECAISVIGAAEALGRFESISEDDLFDIEYWSLEQAKLGHGTEPEFAGHVVAVTGGAGAIGAATAKAFAAKGAVVVVLDLDGAKASEVAATFGGLGLACDVTDGASVGTVFERICTTYGGIDIVVSNAGAAWQGKIGEVEDDLLRQSFELNFFAHQLIAKTAVRIMQQQGTGGVLLFNASKQAVNPGPDFGPYGLPKAATLSLMRQYAVDYGDQGIRSNAVNADRIRSGLLTDTMVADRSKARGVSEANYMAGNLLGREVTAEDVAQAFVDLARAEKTTGAAITVDGGNIAAALR